MRMTPIVGEGADRVELLQLVRTTRPDIVMVDADLLAAAGLGLIRDVREISPDTKLLLMGIRADRRSSKVCKPASRAISKRAARSTLQPARAYK